MIRKLHILAVIFLGIALFVPAVACAEYEAIYHYYVEEGFKAFEKKDFENAVFYFKTAHAIDPARSEPLQYLNLVISQQEILKSKKSESSVVIQDDPNIPAAPSETLSERVVAVPNPPPEPAASFERQTQRSFTAVTSSGSLKHFAHNEDFRLNDSLWPTHTQLTLEIEIGKKVNVFGSNITRYLSTVENIFEIERLDKSRITIKALKRGNTILYIWDDKGRWTFNVHCVYPFESDSNVAGNDDLRQELTRPFQLLYSNNWSTLHSGPDLKGMTQRNLIFTNWLGITGETPYGIFDASIDTYKFPQSTEVVGQRIGLVNGRVGPFRDFTIRGWDTYAGLSELTIPGRSFRGFSLKSYAFNHDLLYSYFRGQDESVSIYSTTGSLQTRESYLEGFKLTLNPDKSWGQYSFNFARGYGDARFPEFEDKLFSLESMQKVKDVDIYGEIGYDSDTVASNIRSVYKRENNLEINLHMRDISPDYSTLFGLPSYSGQVGAAVSMYVKPREFRWDTFLDVYRDRASPNEDHPDLVNFDFSTSYSRPIDDFSSLSAYFSYINTPQVISPREFTQLGSAYSKSIKVGKSRFLNLSLGQSMQWSRYDDSPTSDYDRLSLRGTMNYKLFKYLYCSISYERLFVRDVFNEIWSYPGVFESGFSYSAPVTDKLSLNYGFNYRNEEQTDTDFSFLAGQDSLSHFVSLTYKPESNVSIFLDSQLRHVLPEDHAQADYYDLNLMLGMESKWDLPFHWSPTGTITGIIYKDYNGNSLQDKNEPGMSGIKVVAGKVEALTNENGEYSLNVNAKKTTVKLDLKTIPKGFVLSTALMRDVVIIHHKAIKVNFGLSARSGIYGVAFLDINKNSKPDRGDKFLSNVVVQLDTGEITKTDFSGSYFFENVNPGKRKLRININSIPLIYMPVGKIDIDINLSEGMTYVHNIEVKENPTAPKQ